MLNIELETLSLMYPEINLDSTWTLRQVIDRVVRSNDYVGQVGYGYAKAYLKAKILSKSGILLNPQETGINPDEVCLESWYESEKQCFQTNYRIRCLNNPITDDPKDRLIRAVREQIVRIIGHSPDMSRIINMCDWPTGTTFATRHGDPMRDMVSPKGGCSSLNLISTVKDYFGDVPLASIEENRAALVDKNFKTKRMIACEPSYSAFYQKGTGRLIRRLLSRAGLDIRQQAQLHKVYVKNATSWGLATIDLKAASDTIAYEVVRLLLPEEWFDWLSRCRSAYTTFTTRKGSKRVYLEKFSAMGNGYTFELETLLFYAITRATISMFTESPVLIGTFGDDIICPKIYASQVCQALEFFGCTINKDKTFVEGPFHESCGADYLDDVDVTAVYMRGVCSTLRHYIELHNKIWRWANRFAEGREDINIRIALSNIRRSARKVFSLARLPSQPSCITSDYGFITNNDPRLDVHGDIILPYALVRRTSSASLLGRQIFYYIKTLRGGTSMNDRYGHLTYVSSECDILRHNVKVWRSSIDDPKVGTWAPEEVTRAEAADIVRYQPAS